LGIWLHADLSLRQLTRQLAELKTCQTRLDKCKKTLEEKVSQGFEGTSLTDKNLTSIVSGYLGLAK